MQTLRPLRRLISSLFIAKRIPDQRRNALRTPATVLLQESPVAGFQYHRGEAIWPFLTPGTQVRLQREYHNPHDRHAVAVWFHSEHLGYLPRIENHTIAELMDRSVALEARIVRLLESDNPWRRIRLSIALRGLEKIKIQALLYPRAPSSALRQELHTTSMRHLARLEYAALSGANRVL